MSLTYGFLSGYGSQMLRNTPFRALGTSAVKNVGPKAAADEEEFRVLELKTAVKKGRKTFRRLEDKPILPPRYKQQKIDQNWGNVWPTARVFHPATVPFPLRQGYPKRGQAPPDKWGNTELMKIPNFLHLTPPVIERHCEALKKFCTSWPSGLETPEKQENHFPVTVIKSTYLHSSPTIRDEKARIVTLK
ncbi:28S ribosomal protein S35, mitochondrial, partial [Halocaridina rubra]